MAVRVEHPLRLTQLGVQPQPEGAQIGDQPDPAHGAPGPAREVKDDVMLALLLERDGRSRLSPIDAASYVRGTDLAAHLPREIWHARAMATVADPALDSDSAPEWWETFADEQVQ